MDIAIKPQNYLPEILDVGAISLTSGLHNSSKDGESIRECNGTLKHSNIWQSL
jgi:hypothetical protein